MENYSAAWKVLEELVPTLKAKGVTIPSHIAKKLRTTRATIAIHEADPTYEETTAVLEAYLVDLESELLNLAEKEFGKEYSNDWLEKIGKAKHSKPEPVGAKRGFPAGVPRGDYWIRVEIGDTVTIDELRETATNQGLALKEESPKLVVIHGEQSAVKQLIR
ncbi:MAG: DUF2096 family protein, partial [Candidatus Thorarchaeota archaeon]|nr:DUF2096 family protein [Candidatus Thorarchaeota archaeon]